MSIYLLLYGKLFYYKQSIVQNIRYQKLFMFKQQNLGHRSNQKLTYSNIKEPQNFIHREKIYTQNNGNNIPSSHQSIKNQKYYKGNIISTSDESRSNQQECFLGNSQNVLYKKQMMEMLNQNYKKSIHLKQSRIQQLKNLERQQEKKYFERQRLATEFLNSKLQQKIRRQRIQAQNDYQRGIQLKINARLQKQEENRKQRQKLNKVQQNRKQIFFKQFYSQHDQKIKQQQMGYILQVLPQLKNKERQKQKITLRGIEQNQMKYKKIQEQIKKNNQKRKQELRAELKRQIQEKQIKKHRRSDSQYLSSLSSRYSEHNTIINPVSYNVNPQNKYVINQIQKGLAPLQRYESQILLNTKKDKFQRNIKMSPLARNGSQVLL